MLDSYDDPQYNIMNNDDDSIRMPIDGALDLHTFNPSEVKELIPEYISACLEKRIFRIRIIHGKGTGTLREIVHSILQKHPAVLDFRHESNSGGGWGATVVDLKNI
ncbi:MAG: Smr/MutS family protein [candidate division Zixibacteria bacterium]